jgi:C-terminal processing protease CtpA/Prc
LTTSTGKNVLYIKVTTFSPPSSYNEAQTSAWLTDFATKAGDFIKAASQRNASEFIVDVRGNGGGLVCASRLLRFDLF